MELARRVLCFGLTVALVAGATGAQALSPATKSVGQSSVGSKSPGPQTGGTLTTEIATPKVSPTALSFGQVQMATGGSVLQATLRNTSKQVATVQGITVEGDHPGDFLVSLSEPFPIEIAPRGEVTVTVTFDPLAKGARSATIVFEPPNRRVDEKTRLDLSGAGIGLPGDEVSINCAGGDFLGAKLWNADFASTAGGGYNTEDPIANTTEGPLYKSARVGSVFGYDFQLPPGLYRVDLHFAETEFNAPGQRVLHCVAEGLLKVAGLDIYAEAGHDTAYIRSFTLNVIDGKLDLDFFGVAGTKALVAGIDVHAEPVLSVFPEQVDFGAVAGGGSDQLDLVFDNDGLGPVEITQVEFLAPTQGDSTDFSVDVAGSVVSGDVGYVSHAISHVMLTGEQLLVPIVYMPTNENLNEFVVRFSGDFGTKQATVTGLGGHVGHPFLHVVVTGPTTIVDYDGTMDEDISLDGSDSHTHEPGKILTSYTWSEGPTQLGTGQQLDTLLTMGDHSITLTIEDDNVPPESWSDDYDVRVVPIDEIPGVRAFYYDADGRTPASQIDSLPVQADFAEVLPTMEVLQDGGAGGSSFSLNFLVKLEARIQVDTGGTYVFDAAGGDVRRLEVAGTSGTDTVNVVLEPGFHDIEARFAVNTLTELPLTVTWNPLAAGSTDIPSAILFHDDSGVVPVINDMPGVGIDLGGNEITISGYGFFPEDQVTVHWGGTDFTSVDFDFQDPQTITFDSPPGAGAIQVTVETPQGVSNARTFNYSPTGPVPINFNLAGFTDMIQKPTAGAFGPDGRFYMGSYAGNLTAITYDENYQATDVTTYTGVSALSNATILGVAFDPWDEHDPNDALKPVRVYVAHCELFAQGGSSFAGPAPYVGQISVLEGPNFDTPIPVVTGLPASNHDHAINGMEFDNNGDLLVCIGGNTNAGVKWPPAGDLPESPLTGAIIKVWLSRPGFNGAITYSETDSGTPNNDQVYGEIVDVDAGVDVSVHAPGLRNSWDLVYTTGEKVFATDNGPNNGFGPYSTGPDTEMFPDPQAQDEVELIEYGNYYGHPNRNRGRTDPRQNIYRDNAIASIPGEFVQTQHVLPSSTNGIIEYRSRTFGEQMYRDLLILKWGGKPRHGILSADERTILSAIQISDYLGALDLAMGPGGALVGTDYSNNRVRAIVPADPTLFGLKALDITPWRAPATGGYPFVIGGVGFGNLGDTTVTIGGIPAVLDSVTPTRITGTTPVNPSPTTSLVDVVVTVGGNDDTIPKAFRYLFPKGTELGEWETGLNANAILGEVACGVIDGVMYMVGEGSGKTLGYDIAAKTWNNNLLPRTFKGHHHGAEVYDGKLYLIGGLSNGSEGLVQIYDPQLDSWSMGSSMPVDYLAGSVSTALIDGKIYAAGGIIGGSTTNRAAVYDPLLDTWTDIASMPQGRNHTASATDGEKLWVFGGRTGCNCVTNGFDTVQIYDPDTDTWESSLDMGSTLAPLPQARGGMGKAVWYQGEFYVFGGETATGAGATPDDVYDRVDVYDPVANTWRLEAPLPTARHGIFPVLYQSRIFVACGGVQAANSQSVVFEIFTRQ